MRWLAVSVALASFAGPWDAEERSPSSDAPRSAWSRTVASTVTPATVRFGERWNDARDDREVEVEELEAPENLADAQPTWNGFRTVHAAQTPPSLGASPSPASAFPAVADADAGPVASPVDVQGAVGPNDFMKR